MADKEKASEAKAKGNAAFQAKDFEEAIRHFTTAIQFDPTDHVFFSNRSACYASLEQYDKAHEDGTQCVNLKPDWPKGYTRKGLAEFFLQRYDEAADTYKAGVKLAPEDATLKEGLQKAMDAKYDVQGSGPGMGMGSLFGSVDLSKLAAAAARNPKLKAYMQDEHLMQKLKMVMQLGNSNVELQPDPLMQLLQQDPRLLEVVMALQGFDVTAMEPQDFADETSSAPPAAKRAKTERSGTEEPKKEEPPAPEDLRSAEQKEADEFKSKGNELYKKKQFAEALEMYDKAIEKEPNNLTYYNNKCAVWIEMGAENYDKVLDTCLDLINRRYEINSANRGGASFEKVAKVFARMASVYEKKKQFSEAIEFYQKSLTEDNNRHTRNALRDCERAKEKFEKENYEDPEKAEAHREKGNEFFKQQNWASAKAEYDEAVRRNPRDPKLFSNRAAALTKLLAYPDALRDLDECLKLDPTFVKAYSRKGAAHFFMKEYHKAVQAYEQGLQVDPNNEECQKGHDEVLRKISEINRSDNVDEEQLRHAMADPEIQKILHDPQIKMFLSEMKQNPQEAQKAMAKDDKLAEAVSKLMAAGIIRTR